MNKRVKEIAEQDPKRKIACDFCHSTTINSLEWGPMYQLDGVTVHYFCMLFSAGLSQHGADEDGILGFMPSDIKKELRRGEKLRCKFCRQRKATIGCSVKNCKASYHYTCGLKNDSAFQFIGNYESYCSKHRQKVHIPLSRKMDYDCPICFVDVPEGETPLWPPCCKKRVFHKRCILEMAKTSGIHFFKCPLCNDKEKFSEAMRMEGVYLPDRDAAWETEPNAFADHTRLHSRCDADNCLCTEPEGRNFSSNSDKSNWKIVRCGGCGAFATHKLCGNLKNLTWRCETCSKVLSGNRIQRHVYDESSDDEESRPPVMRPGEAINRVPATNIVGESPSISLNPSSESEDSEEDSEDASQTFNPIYGKNFIVEADEDSSDEEVDDEADEIFISPDSKFHKRLFGPGSTNASSSSSVTNAKVGCSPTSSTGEPSGNTATIPITLPPVGRDTLIKSGSRKVLPGRIEIEEPVEVISESDCRNVKIARPKVSSRRRSLTSRSKRGQGCLKKAIEKVSGVSAERNHDSSTELESDQVQWTEVNKQEPDMSGSSGISVIEAPPVQAPNHEVVDLDSDVEIVDEKVKPSGKSAFLLELEKKARLGNNYRPPPIIRQTFPQTISNAFIAQIQKAREYIHSSIKGNQDKPTSGDADIVVLDSGEESSSKEVETEQRKGGSRTGKKRRELIDPSQAKDSAKSKRSRI